jgi:hypothetical protein
VVAARQLHEVLPDGVHARRVPVHAAEDGALCDDGNNGCARVRVRRRPAIGREGDFERDDGLAGGVAELVVVEELDRLTGPGAVGGC